MVPCPVCSLPLILPGRGVEETVFCPECRRDVTVVAWPALDRVASGPRVPQAVVDGEAACFSCPQRAATGVCEGCGCFTCPACEAQWFGESLCLGCLHARRELLAAPRFRHRTLLHDNIALMMLVLPIITIPFYGVLISVLASPVALVWAIRHRRSPRGLPPRGPWRLLLAAGLALLLMGSVLFGVGALVYSVAELGNSARRSAMDPPSGGPAAESPQQEPEPVAPAKEP